MLFIFQPRGSFPVPSPYAAGSGGKTNVGGSTMWTTTLAQRLGRNPQWSPCEILSSGSETRPLTCRNEVSSISNGSWWEGRPPPPPPRVLGTLPLPSGHPRDLPPPGNGNQMTGWGNSIVIGVCSILVQHTYRTYFNLLQVLY